MFPSNHVALLLVSLASYLLVVSTVVTRSSSSSPSDENTSKSNKGDPYDMLSYELFGGRPFNFSFKSDQWRLYINGSEITDDWNERFLSLSGREDDSANFLITKQPLLLDDVLSPQSNWTLKTLLYLTRNSSTSANADSKSELALLMVANQTSWIQQSASKNGFTNITGIGLYAIKRITSRNSTMISFFIQNTLFSAASEVQITCSIHMDANFADDFYLPIALAKLNNLLIVKVVQQDQACTLHTHLPRHQIANAKRSDLLYVAVGARFGSDELVEVISMTFSSNDNKTIQGIFDGKEEDISLLEDLPTDDEFDDYDLEQALETVIKGVSDSNSSSVDDNVVVWNDSNMVPAFDATLANYSLQLPGFNKDNWRLMGNARLAGDKSTLILTEGKGFGAIVTKKPLPTELFDPDVTWQYIVGFEVNVSNDNGNDVLTTGIATEESYKNFPRNQPLTPRTVVGAMVEILTSSVKIIGTRHAEEIRLYYGQNYSIVKCTELTTTEIQTRSVSVTFKLRRNNILAVDFDSIWHRGSESYSCNHALYVADFDQVIAGAEDSLHIGAYAEVVIDDHGQVKLDLLKVSRLIKAPDESGPAFLLPLNGTDLDVAFCPDLACEMDCSTGWIEPPPVIMWYRQGRMDSKMTLIPTASGFNRLSMFQLTLNDSIVGDKITCILSNDLGAIWRTFSVVKAADDFAQQKQQSWWQTSRVAYFLIDSLVTLVAVAAIFVAVRLATSLRARRHVKHPPPLSCWSLLFFKAPTCQHVQLLDDMSESILRLDNDGLENL